MWEHAARAANRDADWALAIELAGRAREYHLQAGQARAAARAQAITAEALSQPGRYSEAREQLTAALQVLRADPDTDTVDAVRLLAALEGFAGSPDADRLSAEALTLGQALGVDTGELADLFLNRGLYLARDGRDAEAAAYLRESARLAGQAGDNRRLGTALFNLANLQAATGPAAAAEAARAAVGHLRRTGARRGLAYAVVNLAHALEMLGDWDTAEAELTGAAEADGLAGDQYFACYRGWLAALRGDVATAATLLAGLPGLRASDNLQDQAGISIAEAFTMDARGRPQDTLRLARATLAHAGTLGINHNYPRWAWPLAARAAHDLHDSAATTELLALLDTYQPGSLAPMLRAERDLVRARLAARDGDPAAGASLAAAVGGLRALSTPYHLAHGLLDHAWYLTRTGDTERAAAATEEARDIAGRLHCQPLLDRAARLVPAKSAIQDRIAAVPDREESTDPAGGAIPAAEPR